MDLPKLNLPPYPFRLEERAGQAHIFDPIRKKWLVWTPEEWVRQHLVQLLVQGYEYPKGLLNLEKQHKDQNMPRRTDVICRNREGDSYLLVECKAPEVGISDQVLLQASNYNRIIQAPYLIITNGLQTFAWERYGDKYQSMTDLPGRP